MTKIGDRAILVNVIKLGIFKLFFITIFDLIIFSGYKMYFNDCFLGLEDNNVQKFHLFTICFGIPAIILL